MDNRLSAIFVIAFGLLAQFGLLLAGAMLHERLAIYFALITMALSYVSQTLTTFAIDREFAKHDGPLCATAIFLQVIACLCWCVGVTSL